MFRSESKHNKATASGATKFINRIWCFAIDNDDVKSLVVLCTLQTWPCSIRCKRSRARQHLAASTTAVLYRTLLHEAFFALGAFIALEAFIARFGASSRALQHLAKSSFIAFLAFLSPAWAALSAWSCRSCSCTSSLCKFFSRRSSCILSAALRFAISHSWSRTSWRASLHQL